MDSVSCKFPSGTMEEKQKRSGHRFLMVVAESMKTMLWLAYRQW